MAVIERLLRAGAAPRPNYREADALTHDVMEGRHRLVAFHRFGYQTIQVCRATRAAPLQERPKDA